MFIVIQAFLSHKFDYFIVLLKIFHARLHINPISLIYLPILIVSAVFKLSTIDKENGFMYLLFCMFLFVLLVLSH